MPGGSNFAPAVPAGNGPGFAVVSGNRESGEALVVVET